MTEKLRNNKLMVGELKVKNKKHTKQKQENII